jgi:hypothetical protein
MLLTLDASDWLLVAPALMPLLLIDFVVIVALLHHKPTISSSRDRLTNHTLGTPSDSPLFPIRRALLRWTIPV